MTAGVSFSGLASGLDTASLIDQLMQLEAVPQTRLRTRASREQLVVNAMQTLNARISALATQAADLVKPSAWATVAATSSNTGVSVTAGTGASPGAFSLRVDQTAVTHRLEHASAAGLTTADTVPTTIRIDNLDGSAPLELTTDGTLRGLLTAVNDPANGTGLRATAVKVGTDSYRLLVESTTTGSTTDFTLTDASDGSELLGGATVRAGRDAQVTLGDSIVATSQTNTFADLVPGVTVTLAASATGSSDIELAHDATALSAKVKDVVDSLNAALTEIDTLTKYNAASKTSGLLGGDTTSRAVRSQLQAAAVPGDGTSLADLGIQTDRYGKLVFDQTAFDEAYAADPAGVQARMTSGGTGFLARAQNAAEAASDSTTGSLTTAITGRTTAIGRLNDGIEAWDLRLELRRTALTRQFTALEVALSEMNSQSNWLAGQIDSLSATSGS